MDHLGKEEDGVEHTVVDLESGEDGFISSLNSKENSSELLLLREEKKGGGEEQMGTLSEKQKKKKKKSPKKPPKPPKPPRGPSLDAADVKLMKEISELAMLKRARMERVKAMKNLKAASLSSNSNLCALVVTLLFCLVLLFQGLFFRGNSLVSFHGSPESTDAVSGGLISVKHYEKRSASSSVGLGP